ncbi:MAG: carbohydrate ABC transporter permease [Alkalispirochaetaceae bacterium]
MKRQYANLAAREARLAAWMLIPAFLIVFAIILFPVLLNFWISFKSVRLGDLRPPTPAVREEIVEGPNNPGEQLVVSIRARNSSQREELRSVVISGYVPPGLSVVELPDGFEVEGNTLRGSFERWPAAFTDTYRFVFEADAQFFEAGWAESTRILFAEAAGETENKLFSFNFTLDNYRFVLGTSGFWEVLGITFLYTLLSTVSAIVLGLLAAQLVNAKFLGKGVLRGLLLFPYVAPVISVAFAWSFFLDPFSGTVNALLQRFGIVDEGISFLSERFVTLSLLGAEVQFPLALSTVIAFQAWRYFPFAFLFILSRLQAIPGPLYESADVDGATPYQKFFMITVPQVAGVMGTLFLLRFMWTFNKFDDVFLLTGGAAGTKILPIEVYDNAFGRADIGAGAATAVLLFAFLAVFLGLYFKYTPEEE